MSNTINNEYVELLIRNRWKLIEAIWLLHGIFVRTKIDFGAKTEHFFTNATVETSNFSLEIGRLSEAFLDQMLECDLTEEIDKIRISDWQEWTCSWCESIELKNSIKKLWHALNCKADIKKCEVCYIDANGKWYALAPESMWNAEYLLKFAQDEGIDITWLTNEIKQHRKVPKQYALSSGT
ncbi:MAG TPA: hypothetical protein DCX09_00635 [Gammaproteobacteria bacterium]|nr:hypothetical protein [Gammaproteobacteria bacterium]RPG46582.1 MAG: hypothetical protein CBD23_001000 [Gammaproteobacteria bacterium TMED163]HAU23164.1 hypothetical protein [Gammaproteobacteria bacterium]